MNLILCLLPIVIFKIAKILVNDRLSDSLKGELMLLDVPEDVFKEIQDTIAFTSSPHLEPTDMLSIGNELYVVSPSGELTLGEWIDMDQLSAAKVKLPFPIC